MYKIVFRFRRVHNSFVTVVMRNSQTVAPVSEPKIEAVEKTAPRKYFKLPLTILLLFGMCPINANRNIFLRLSFSTYFWFLHIFVIGYNTASKGIVLPYQKNLDDLTDNISFFINHAIAIFKIALFMFKREELMGLVERIEGENFRHQDCSQTFSANRLIREAVRTTQAVYLFLELCLVGITSNSALNVIMERFEIEHILETNGTEFVKTTPEKHRELPFHSWYPFSDQVSPNYELVFAYQITGLFITGTIVLALDTLIFSFVIHIKVQFRILSHNLRFIRSHAEGCQNHFSTISQPNLEVTAEMIELDLRRHILHHQAIIQMTKDLEALFTYQLLIQFICSLLATCTLMWQVSSTPVLSARFGSMLSHLVATAFQLFMYCWFGNEMMLGSLSVADAAWDSGWEEIASRRYCHGVAMIIHRSQKAITITAGGFAGLTLETFMTISRAAYSCFTVLKKVNN